ncbi:MAG: hypothetical protein ACPH45_04655, partial [Porticoccaceae bacterium]
SINQCLLFSLRSPPQQSNLSLRRLLAIITPIAIGIFLGACSDPYEACMKEEKRKNAYLGEADYLQQSSQLCAKKVRQSQ